MSEQVANSSAAAESEPVSAADPAPPRIAKNIDRAQALRELEEARRLYDVAALVHERGGLGSIDSAPIAHKALLVLMRLITRLHGLEPESDAALIAQMQRLNAKESLVGYDVTEDLTLITRAKERFFEIESETNRADVRRYDRAFVRSAKLFGVAQDQIGDLMPDARPSPLRHWKLVAVGALALTMGFVLGGRGKRSAPPALPPVVVAPAEQPNNSPTGTPASVSGQFEATFFKDPELKQAALTRMDSALDFNWASGEPPELGQNDHFSVRWVGKLNITDRASYEFYLTSDDGSRLFIDDNLVVDNWGVHTAVTKQASVELEAGLHTLRLEFFDGMGDAVVKLEWSSNGQPRRVVSSRDLK